MDRRRFLGLAGMACGGAAIGGCGRGADSGGPGGSAAPGRASLTAGKGKGEVYVGKDADPVTALRSALAAAGGLEFIRPGSRVVLKPNAAWSRTPAQAANTDPRLLSAMIELCREAGAGKITIFEHTIDRPAAQVLAVSGIGAAARQGGAELIYGATERDFAPIEVPRGRMMKRDTLARAVLEADVFINMPKAKHHSQTQLTLGLKNLMGVNFNRQAWHSGPDLNQFIADYASAVAVDLTVMDASRILLTNGPKGPGKTREPGEVIVSFDPVAADAYACGLFDLDPSAVGYIGKAAELGLGEGTLSNIVVRRA
ncbi:MAG: DUF362 domain-containing protein [Acidobacteria bacterium]|nr:DUF362 domain-containing protein [Acidobacteriota bacterium]